MRYLTVCEGMQMTAKRRPNASLMADALSQTFVSSDSTRQKRGLEPDAKQSARKEKLQSSVFANWLAAASQTFVKSVVLVRKARRVRIAATSAVVVEVFELMAWMWINFNQ